MTASIPFRKTEELSVQYVNFHLALYDLFWGTGQVLTGYSEEPPGVVHLDLALASSARWQFALDDDMGAGSRRRELRVAVEVFDELAGPVLYLTGLRVSAVVQVDAGVGVVLCENEPDTIITMLPCGSHRLFIGAPRLQSIHGGQVSGVWADGHLGELAVPF